MSVVMIIGMGDMGERIAAGLAVGGKVRRLVLAGRSPRSLADIAATTASVGDCVVEPALVDATRQDDVAELFHRTRPDLVVQCCPGPRSSLVNVGAGRSPRGLPGPCRRRRGHPGSAAGRHRGGGGRVQRAARGRRRHRTDRPGRNGPLHRRRARSGGRDSPVPGAPLPAADDAYLAERAAALDAVLR